MAIIFYSKITIRNNQRIVNIPRVIVKGNLIEEHKTYKVILEKIDP